MIYKLGHTYPTDPQTYIQSGREPEETDRLIFYIQALYNEMVTERLTVDLTEVDVAEVLIEAYGYQPLNEIEQKQAEKEKNYYYIDLFDNWERFCGYQYHLIQTNPHYHRRDIEPLLWQKYNRTARQDTDNPEVHLLTSSDASYNILSLWFHETYFLDEDTQPQPLVFLRGLCPDIRQAIQPFFPLAKALKDSSSLAIPLRHYPLSDYSYEWDGKHILITYRSEWQLRIRYDVDMARDIAYPIRTPYQLKQILMKMGYR